MRAAHWPLLTEVNLRRFNGVHAPGLLQALSNRAPAIRVLSFDCCHLDDAEVNLSLANFKSLECAHISANIRVKLEVKGTEAIVPRLHYLSIDVAASTLAGLSFPCLNRLRLERQADLAAVHAALASCPALHTLIVDSLGDAEHKSTRSYPNVRTLRVSQRNPARAMQLLSCLPALSELSIVFAYPDERWYIHFARFVASTPLTQLSTLRITHCAMDSVEKMKSIVSALPSLRLLTAPDTVFNELQSWCANRGRQIEHAGIEQFGGMSFSFVDWEPLNE